MSGTDGMTASALDPGEELRRRVEELRAARPPSVPSLAALRVRTALGTPGRGC